MATQKENKMSQRMKGAFGKMKSSKMKFNMTKPGNSSKSTKQLKNMFNRFGKNKDDDQKWSSILSGSWEIELPVGEFLNTAGPSSTEDSSQSDHKKDSKSNNISDPNSVSNRQCPMIQIYENLKVLSLPLPTDIANPHIHKKYLKSKSIITNLTRVKIIEDKDNNNNDYKMHLVHFHRDVDKENETNNVILEGTINICNYTIRWGDGSSWTKQGIQSKDDEEIEDTPSTNNKDNNIISNEEINSLRLQLEIFKEKEQMAKSQTQATMGQYADLSMQYAKLTTEKENLERDYNDITLKYDTMESGYSQMKEELCKNNLELDEVRSAMVFKQQMEIQSKLTKLKKENIEYSKSIKLQQERILSLGDQLQTAHIATRQYTKTIEDLESKIRIINNEKLEIKRVLNEMNNKFVTSQTNLDDARHKEMIVNDKHNKIIKLLNDKHQIEIEKLERGFQETLRQNERKMQEMQTLRNSYEKKNASLTKDVKRLIIQLEKQASNTYHNSVSRNMINFSGVIDETQVIQKLRKENAQLSEELMRKSQSLVDALRALAEFNRNPVDITKAITSNLSHTKKYIYNNNNNEEENEYKDVSDKLQMSMDASPQSQLSQMSSSPPVNSNIVIGAKYSIDDLDGMNMNNINNNITRLKFNKFKNKFGNKMKQQINKIQQKKVNEEIQKRKSVLNEEELLNELNAKNVIKESEKVLITKTKQQLNAQCDELQGLANELSSTIEQKEVILESLRFANTYLGKRVIALEKIVGMTPGIEIKNQDELIRDALNISPNDDEEDDKQQDDDGSEVNEQVEIVNVNQIEDDDDDEEKDKMEQELVDNDNIINEEDKETDNKEEKSKEEINNQNENDLNVKQEDEIEDVSNKDLEIENVNENNDNNIPKQKDDKHENVNEIETETETEIKTDEIVSERQIDNNENEDKTKQLIENNNVINDKPDDDKPDDDKPDNDKPDDDKPDDKPDDDKPDDKPDDDKPDDKPDDDKPNEEIIEQND